MFFLPLTIPLHFPSTVAYRKFLQKRKDSTNMDYPNTTYIKPRAKGWIMYGMDSKLKLGDQLKNSEQSKRLGDL